MTRKTHSLPDFLPEDERLSPPVRGATEDLSAYEFAYVLVWLLGVASLGLVWVVGATVILRWTA